MNLNRPYPNARPIGYIIEFIEPNGDNAPRKTWLRVSNRASEPNRVERSFANATVFHDRRKAREEAAKHAGISTDEPWASVKITCSAEDSGTSEYIIFLRPVF